MKNCKEHGIELRERIYQFIVQYVSDNYYTPTIKEIADAVGLKSSSSVHNHLTHLEIEGRIKTKPNCPRTIKVTEYEYKKEED